VRKQAGAAGVDPASMTVRIRLADDSIYEEPGKINFVDVQVAQGTDTVAVRASLPNPDGWLIDGQLVTVIVEAARPERALVVPQQALQADQAGLFVLVVDSDDTVQVRRVVAGARLDDATVIRQGLEAGERIIVEGVQKVRPGETVQPTAATGVAPA
jgi:membrane fusion protein (multidrug efflux system)